MLRLQSSKLSERLMVEARARKFNIVRRVNVVDVSGLEPPLTEPEQVEPQQPQVEPQPPQKDLSAHPFFWKVPGSGGQETPPEIRWIWNPMTGDMNIGTQSRHSGQTPRGTDWDSVLRGFYFPEKKLVAIRPFFWPDGKYDQWDGDHADLSADVQSTFVMALEPTLKQQDPEIEFQTNIDNAWLQGIIGGYSW